jgi:hypothetical protein
MIPIAFIKDLISINNGGDGCFEMKVDIEEVK